MSPDTTPSNQMDSLKDKYKPLTNLITNEGLLEPAPSLQGLNLVALDAVPNGALYYGTGLTTPREIGVGLPFDVLGMILVAERIKRAAGLKAIYHHVADTHAKTNDWINPSEVDTRARSVRETLERVAANLKIEGFSVMLSSEFDSSPEYVELVKYFDTRSDKHEYVRREMADMRWYQERHRVTVKAGWIIQATEIAEGFDERLFDREFTRIEGNTMSFVYTKPGRTFDLSRPKVSPYIQVANERRLLLQRGENVLEKMNEAVAACGDIHLGGARKHLENIVRAYEKLFGLISKDKLPLETKLQVILDLVTA